MDAKTTGISTTTLLGITFIVLKLCKVIDWDWIWVLCPFWAVIAIFLAVAGLALIGVLFAKIFGG